MLRTNVYIDGFNLFYGACKGKVGAKWLNPQAICSKLLQNHNIVQKIWYFSAEVAPRPNNPGTLNRQHLYFRALKTLSICEIKLGMFLQSETCMPLAEPLPEGPTYARVIKTEEKGSDVNLAVQMLVDAFDDEYDLAVVISNDTDLLGPIKIVQSRFHKKVGVLNPQKRPSRALKAQANFYKNIRSGPVCASQFPDVMTDAMGDFCKPSGW